MTFFNSKKLTGHELANRRILSFVALVLVVLLMGVLGWFPSNSIAILKPLNGFIGWFAIFCVAFCIVNLFNKEKVPGEVEFSNSAFINLPFRWAVSTLDDKLYLDDFTYLKKFNVMAEDGDLHDCLKIHHISFFKWWKDFRNCDCTFIYNKKDKAPFYHYLKHKALGAVKRFI